MHCETKIGQRQSAEKNPEMKLSCRWYFLSDLGNKNSAILWWLSRKVNNSHFDKCCQQLTNKATYLKFCPPGCDEKYNVVSVGQPDLMASQYWETNWLEIRISFHIVYSMKCAQCFVFFCVTLWLHNGFMGSIYSYSSGLFLWHTAMVAIKLDIFLFFCQ